MEVAVGGRSGRTATTAVERQWGGEPATKARLKVRLRERKLQFSFGSNVSYYGPITPRVHLRPMNLDLGKLFQVR